MSDILKDILQLLGVAGVGGNLLNANQYKPFTSYGAISPDGGNLYSHLNKLSGDTLGPLGSLAFKIIAGDLFLKTNRYASFLNNTIFPMGLTYAGAIQSIRARRLLNISLKNIDKLLLKLEADYIKQYNILTGQPGATHNSVSWPRVLNTLFDPNLITPTVLYMNLAAANVVNWHMRSANPFANTGPKNITQALTNVITLASALNALAYLQDQSKLANIKDLNKYGGYSPSALAKLTSVITSLLDLSKAGENLAKLLENLTSTISKSIQPLRDVFKNDILATVDAIKTVTGRNITSLTKALLEQASTSMTDTMRYTGMSAGQYAMNIADMSKRLLLVGKASSNTHWASIQGYQGAADLAAMLSVGGAPYGINNNIYKQFVKDRTAASQVSLHTKALAKAYAIAQSTDKNLSILQFMVDTGGSILVAMNKYNIADYNALNAGVNSRSFLVALNSGKLAAGSNAGAYNRDVKLAANRAIFNGNSAAAVATVSNLLISNKSADIDVRLKLANAKTDDLIKAIFSGLNYTNEEAIELTKAFNNISNDSLYGQRVSNGNIMGVRQKRANDFSAFQKELRRIYGNVFNSSNTLQNIGKLILDGKNLGDIDYSTILNLLSNAGLDIKAVRTVRAISNNSTTKKGLLDLSIVALVAHGKVSSLLLGEYNLAIRSYLKSNGSVKSERDLQIVQSKILLGKHYELLKDRVLRGVASESEIKRYNELNKNGILWRTFAGESKQARVLRIKQLIKEDYIKGHSAYKNSKYQGLVLDLADNGKLDKKYENISAADMTIAKKLAATINAAFNNNLQGTNKSQLLNVLLSSIDKLIKKMADLLTLIQKLRSLNSQNNKNNQNFILTMINFIKR